jgi:hypothetical protein
LRPTEYNCKDWATRSAYRTKDDTKGKTLEQKATAALV